MESLATLGDSLALCQQWVSAGGLARGSLDVGAYEKTEILLIGVDAQGRRAWSEVFAADRLGDAVARLYERYAEPSASRLRPGPRGAASAAGRPLECPRRWGWVLSKGLPGTLGLTMKAVIIDEHGGPEVMAYREVESPSTSSVPF